MKRGILWVDDQPMALMPEMTALRRLGFDLTTARTGMEAILQFETMLFDAILLDWSLPDCYGDDLLRILDNTHPRAIFIFMSLLEPETFAGTQRPSGKPLFAVSKTDLIIAEGPYLFARDIELLVRLNLMGAEITHERLNLLKPIAVKQEQSRLVSARLKRRNWALNCIKKIIEVLLEAEHHPRLRHAEEIKQLLRSLYKKFDVLFEDIKNEKRFSSKCWRFATHEILQSLVDLDVAAYRVARLSNPPLPADTCDTQTQEYILQIRRDIVTSFQFANMAGFKISRKKDRTK
jgi:CheY-like chemotaxis protein